MTDVLFWQSPVGALTLAGNGGGLTHLLFGKAALPQAQEAAAPLLLEARRQLEEYFSGARTAFDLPLSPQGTDFQRRVWDALLTIPYGETRSYRDIAELVGRPKGFRAVGMANHRNPISIIVPCHRVVGKNGSLTGYGGGLDTKRFLLELERRRAAVSL